MEEEKNKNEELAKVFKKCLINITSASLNKRKDVFSELAHCLENNVIGDAQLKGISKILIFTLHRYRDNKSRQLVLTFVKNSFLKHGNSAVKFLLSELHGFLSTSRYYARRASASLGLSVLSLCSCVSDQWLSNSIDDDSIFEKLVQVEVLAYSFVCCFTVEASSNRLKDVASKWLKMPKDLKCVSKYLDVILKIETSHLDGLCMIGYIFDNLLSKNAVKDVEDKIKALVDIFVKTTIQTKVRTPKHVLVAVKPFLKCLQHENFQEILPVIQKALLRNPETILEAVGFLFAGLSIDPSKYMEELRNCVPNHLASQNASLRNDAIVAVENLARQCSEPSAVQLLLKKLFTVLSGSEGKLALPEQRSDVLSAISGASSTAISGKSQMEELANVLIENLFPFLLQEGNEAVLVRGLETLKTWSKYFTSKLPANFVPSVQKAISAKTCSSTVRVGYFQACDEAMKGNTLHQGLKFLPTLLQAVEKCKSQVHQAAPLMEALTASTLIARMASLDDVKENEVANFWSTVLDAKKRILLPEKALINPQKDYLSQLSQFMNILFSRHQEKMVEKIIGPWHQAFVVVLLYGDHTAKKRVKGFLGKFMDDEDVDVVQFKRALFTELHKEVIAYEKKCDENEVPVKNFSDAYVFIASCGPTDETTSTETLRNVLYFVHQPVLVENLAALLFTKVANVLGVDLPQFISDRKEELINSLVELEAFEKMHVNAMNTLLAIAPGDLISPFMTLIKEHLEKPALCLVTEKEYGILKTPDGEIYDQSVYESAKLASTKQGNVKRESKAYSYKEQKIEMELKDELKKKKKVTEEKIELTKKQKEQLETIKEEEKNIRDNLKCLEKELIKHSQLLDACLDVPAEFLTFHYLDLMKCCLVLSRSFIAAPYIVPCYIKLARRVFKGDQSHLGELIAYTILRHKQANCSLPSGWCEEKLKDQTVRALNTIYKFVFEQNAYIMMTYTWKKPFSAPAFSLLFPLLRIASKARGSIVNGDEELRMKILQIVMSHSKLRSQEECENLDENGPVFLPRAEMLSLLSEVIIESDGHNKDNKLQQYANKVFDQVCVAASGGVGCATAGADEIAHLLLNILSPCSVLRNASLNGLLEISTVLMSCEEAILHTLARRTMIARYDRVKENAALGESLWERAQLTVNPEMARELIDDVTHVLGDIRLAASLGLCTALSEAQDISGEIVTTLLEIYEEKLKIPAPVIDNLGRNVSPPFVDKWAARHGVGLALEKIAPYVSADMLDTLFHFFVPTSLGDRNEAVRKQMLDAALQYVNHFGQDNMQLLLTILEQFLDSAPDSSSHDVIRQSVIILTGSLAKHFNKTDPRIKPIFTKLMAALATPSQQVQQAVANCLPPLCAAIKPEAGQLIEDLLHKLLESESYGERRGAAYGLAGVIKGLGILSLKQHNVISTLDKAIQDKKVWRHREGALFAFETLCSMLGRLFEPYVVHLLPHLLLCFGDGNQYVREAADETAKAVMKNLSNHGVKLVLPSLLKALEEDAWRTKTGSAELLGAMSFCAPKQLSSCLPSIVPRLTEVLADSHLKVQKAGQQALRQIGGVIKNPEIQEISSIILDALADPNKDTVECLKALLNTSFVHFIDAPSLALIMPTLEKALDQRSSETKKMAAQILGNMYALTDPKDLSPYLPAVVPGLKKSLLDPSPEVRGVSARALGAIVKGMGEDCFNDLMPWLLETLTSDVSSVDRSGAAQGLSEVLYALGQERLDKLMPDVIATTMKTELASNIRDGYLMLFIYLPTTFGEDFTEYIGPIIPPILKGLADEAEYVRDTSLKAGQRIINMYADTAIEFLLPQLEAGLFDGHWRIRYSSVQLLGDLLFKLSGVTGKQTTVGEEDDNFGTAHSSQVIFETLGEGRRNRLYAGLYMGRSDVALTVRQAALHVWKVIVQNTARTLRDILPTLFELLLGCLASDNYDKRQVAARTLGDLVRKLGERILPEIIPILEDGLNNPDADKRQGVCIGLSEIMNSTSRDMISQFEDSLIHTVRSALIDPIAEVRLAASQTFENLHNMIGHRALDGILPKVFEKLDNPDLAEYALDGLKQVMAVKSKSVLPFLVPKLTTPPVNTKALAILSSVAGEALVRHLEKILPAMIQAINVSAEDSESDLEGTKTLILSVEEEVGIRTIIDELMTALKHQHPGIRKVGCQLLAVFCKDTRGDYSQYVQQLFRVIVQSMNDVDEHVVDASWSALDALVKHLDPSEQLQHLSSLKQAIRFVKGEVRNNELPGFCLLNKRGIAPVLPIFREGVLNGPQEVKEQAATLLGEVIKLTSAAALKPSVVHITGPLIRILGDRFNWTVKEAILDTLGLLLEKVGIMLKPFLPQLQTTFIKALNDPTQAVREKAAWALGLLTVLHTRVDSLFTELKNGIKNNEDSGIKETILKALRTTTLRAGGKMSEAVRTSLLEVLQDLLDSSEDGVRVNGGAALGALCQVMADEEIKQLLESSLINVNQALDWTISHGRVVALSYALFDAPGKLFNAVDEDQIIDAVVKYSSNDRVPICTYGIHCLGHLLLHSKEDSNVAPTIVITTMKKSLVHSSMDVKLATLRTVKYVAKTSAEVLAFDRLRYLIPEFISLLRDRNTAVRSLSELTLGFLLQLHKNDEMFNICVSTLTEASTFLQDYRRTVFEKLGDSLATDGTDYPFVT